MSASDQISLPAAPLAKKLDMIGAVLAIVREDHRNEMPPECWAHLHQAQEHIAAAMLAGKPRLAIGDGGALQS